MKRKLQLMVTLCLCAFWGINAYAIESLPISYKGPWQNPVIEGFTATLGSVDNTTSGVSGVFSKATNFFQIEFSENPAAMSYRVRTGSSTSTFKFEVSESANGSSWKVIKTYTELANTTDSNSKMAAVSANPSLEKCDLKPDTRFVKWTLVERQASGGTSIYLSDVNIIPNATTESPKFISLFNNSTPKEEIANEGKVTPTTSTTSVNFAFDKLVFINDYSQIKINNGTSDIAISPYFYSVANKPADYANNIYSCTDSEYLIRISNLVFAEGETYTITVPASNIVDIYGNSLANDINYTFGVGGGTSVNDIKTEKEIQSVEYYTLTGIKVEQPVSGVSVKKVIYTDGSNDVSKIMKQ